MNKLTKLLLSALGIALAFVILVGLMSLCQPVSVYGVILDSDQCYSGHMEYLYFRPGGVLRVQEDLVVDNVNINEVDGMIVVSKGGKLTIKSSLNLNRKFKVQNFGTLIVGNVELQGSDVWIENMGTMVANEIQLSSAGAKLSNYGTITVANFTNFHNGKYIGGNCSLLSTNGLNVNQDNLLTGFGNIKINNTLNLNGILSQSVFNVCYQGVMNQKEKLGGSILSCDFTCQEQPLPIVFGNITGKRVDDEIELSIPVVSINEVKEVSIMYSPDNKNWMRLKVVKPEELQAGKTYVTKVKP